MADCSKTDGKWGYKVVGVYQTKNEQGFNVERIILMRD